MPRARGRSGDALLDPWCGRMLVLPGEPWSLLCRSADPESCLPASPLAGREDFKPRMGIHHGTGYRSNYRPVVSCQPNLSALDNPAVGYTVGPTPAHPLPTRALALRAIGPHQTNSRLRAWGPGSWGTQGLVLSLGPKGKQTPEAAVGGLREVEASRGQGEVALVVIAPPAPAPPSGNKSATISRP